MHDTPGQRQQGVGSPSGSNIPAIDPSPMTSPSHWAFVMLCVTSASNAAFDVLLKNSVIVFAAFHGGMASQELGRVAALAWMLFMAPFFIFSAHGGYFGDRFNKKKWIVAVRCADVTIASLTAYGFYVGNIALLLVLVFAKGTTSALFSPVKYALVADFLPRPAHGMGYAVIEAASMAAILGATYFAAILGADPDARKIGILIFLIAGTSLVLTFAAPNQHNKGTKLPPLGVNPIRPTWQMLSQVIQDRKVFMAILALSWYWGLGALYLSNVAVLVRDTLHHDEGQIAAILFTFTVGGGVGLAVGSLVNHGQIARYLPYVMAVLIAGTGVDLSFSIPLAPSRMLLDFFVIAVASGVYAAYFSSILYRSADESRKSRIFATNNILSSLCIVLVLAISTILVQLQISVATSLTCFAVATLPITLIIMRQLKSAEPSTGLMQGTRDSAP